VGTFGHKHHTVKAQLFCLEEKFVHTEFCLAPPETSIADGMQTCFYLEIVGVARR